MPVSPLQYGVQGRLGGTNLPLLYGTRGRLLVKLVVVSSTALAIRFDLRFEEDRELIVGREQRVNRLTGQKRTVVTDDEGRTLVLDTDTREADIGPEGRAVSVSENRSSAVDSEGRITIIRDGKRLRSAENEDRSGNISEDRAATIGSEERTASGSAQDRSTKVEDL